MVDYIACEFSSERKIGGMRLERVGIEDDLGGGYTISVVAIVSLHHNNTVHSFHLYFFPVPLLCRCFPNSPPL